MNTPAFLRMLSVVVSLVTLVGADSIQAQQSSRGTVQDWLDSLEQALGGEEAIAALRSLSVTAECSGPGGAFETDVDSFRSDWVRFRQTREDGEMTVWSGPEHTWTLDAEQQVVNRDARLRFFVRSHEFHFLLLELASRFSGHRLGGPTMIRSQTCTTILMEDEAGQPASVCLSDSTTLPIMLEMNPVGAAGPVRVFFQDWESKNELQFFRAFDLTEGPERSFRYDYRSIEPNAVSALEFVRPLPEGQRASQAELHHILEEERQAHLETDAARLVANVADELTEISSGMIRHQTKTELGAFFTRMFEGATYDIWEDTEPPKLAVSGDGTLAWMARRVEVHRSASTADGQRRQTRFISAYSSTYERQGGAWKMTSVTSTFVPSSPG